MSFDPAQLNAMLARKQAAVDDARRALDVAMAELRAWREAMQLLGESGGYSAPLVLTTRAQLGSDVNLTLTRRRGPKGTWAAILAALDREFPAGGVFGLNDIERVAAQIAEPILRPTARSQMSNYAKVGIVERVEEGRFRLKKAIQTGASLFKEAAPPKSEEGAA